MPETEPAAPPATQTRSSRIPVLVLIAVLLAGGLAALAWYDTRSRIAATQDELARRLRDIESDARDARSIARTAQETVRESQVRLGQLEARIAESQSQQLALEALYQDLSRNRDEWQLAEARLARADRPQFAPIRRALARDIERLKAAPAVDFPAMAMRMDNLIASIDSLPLAFEERTEREMPAKAPPPDRGLLARLGTEIWNEISQLLVVRRIGATEPPLLPPSQAYFVRENLRLRLLNARASLLARDEAGYREDLRAATGWIQRYFDPRSKATADAVAQLKQLSSVSITFEMPSISESLDAVRGYKSRRERSPG